MNSLGGSRSLQSPADEPSSVVPQPGPPMNTKFASRVFFIAGILGILTLVPQYFLAGKVGFGMPGPIDRVEYFYGFVGVALVWQFAFLVVSRDVMRFRPLMPICVLEKVAWGVPAVLLYLQGRISAELLFSGCFDLMLGLFFVLAYRATAPETARATVGA